MEESQVILILHCSISCSSFPSFFNELACCQIKVDFFPPQAEDSQGAGVQTPIETYGSS
jgi:hypothetical protein